MLGLLEKEEGAAAGVRSGYERRASTEIGFRGGTQLRRPAAAGRRGEQSGAAAVGGTVARGVGREGPDHAGDERSRGIFGGRDWRSPGIEREHGEGEAISGARAAGGNLPEAAGQAAGSAGRTQASKERQACLDN